MLHHLLCTCPAVGIDAVYVFGGSGYLHNESDAVYLADMWRMDLEVSHQEILFDTDTVTTTHALNASDAPQAPVTTTHAPQEPHSLRAHRIHLGQFHV